MRPARPRSVCLTQPHTCTYELSEFHDLWPFILPKVRLEFQILQAPMGKQVFFCSFFFKPGSKAFYNCSPAFNAATWRETSFKSLSVSYGFCLFVCLFFWAGLLVKPTTVMTGCFPEGFQRGKKKKKKALRYESGMTQVLPLLPGPRHQRKRCERWYCKHIAMNTFYPWVTAHAVRWWPYSILTECFR